MALGLLVAAGVDRDAGITRLRQLRQPYGWGLGYAWAAFAKEIPNPASTSYAITNAMVIQGLLEAGAVDESDGELAVIWAAQLFDSGGFYRYSEHAQDAVDTPNASAMWAGVCRRLLIEHPQLVPDGRDEVLGRVDEAIRHIVDLAEPGPWWMASARTRRPDDLIHHGYTLWGTELYRRWGGAVRLPWSPRVAASRMARRTDVGRWPAGSPAMRYAYAASYAPGWAVATDLTVTPGGPRDAAHQTWAKEQG